MPSAVTVWTSHADERSDGWTISSLLVADGDPAEMVALVNEDSDWWEVFTQSRTAVVNVLSTGQDWISEVFARMAPSPGGVFHTGQWETTSHGPRLLGAAAWAGVRLGDGEPERAGWGLLVRATVEWVTFTDGTAALEHRHGTYS